MNIDASGGMGRQLNDDYYAHTDASKAFQQASSRDNFVWQSARQLS